MYVEKGAESGANFKTVEPGETALNSNWHRMPEPLNDV